ncbi:MAG: protease family protein [Actinomycetota bacterium]|nr:protease family protein [Actinomycetota bacterium]
MTTPPPPVPPDGGGVVPPPPPNPYAPPSQFPPYPPPPRQRPVHPQFPDGFPPYPPPGQQQLPPGPPPGTGPTVGVGQPAVPAHPLLYPGAPVTLVDAVVSGRPVKPAGWGIPDFVITFFLWIFFSTVAVGISALLFGDPEVTSGPGIMLALSMPWIGLAGWPLLVSWWKGNGPVIDFGLTARVSDLLWGVAYGLIALVCAAIIAAITTAIFGDFDSAAGEIGASLDSLPLLLLFGVLVGLGAPIVEELAFRGLLFGALAKRGLAPWLSIGISALVFSSFHFEPIRIPLLLSTGIVLGIARYHRRSTTVPIIAHMVNNVPAAIALVLMSS